MYGGGYGSSYGGMGGSRYGMSGMGMGMGMGGGMGMGMGMGGGMDQQYSWLHSIQHFTSSLGYLTEVSGVGFSDLFFQVKWSVQYFFCSAGFPVYVKLEELQNLLYIHSDEERRVVC